MNRKTRLSLYEYREWLVYAAAMLAMFAADRAIPGAPLGLSLFFALASSGLSPLALAATSLLSALTVGSLAFLCAYFCAVCLLTVIFSVYRAKKAHVGAESVFYLAVSLGGFLFWGSGPIVLRASHAALTALFSYVALGFLYPFLQKKRVFRPTPMQLMAGGTLLVVLGTGIYRTTGGTVLYGLSAFCLLLCARLGKGNAALAAATLTLPACFLSNSLAPCGLFFICAALAVALSTSPRFFAAVTPLFVYAAFALWLQLLPFSLPQAVSLGAAGLVYLLLPSSLIKKWENALSSRKEKRLTRAAINRDRTLLSAKMMNLAAVFREIETLFAAEETAYRSDAKEGAAIAEEVVQEVCERCKNRDTCMKIRNETLQDVEKAIAIGITKGRISMLDLPGSLLRECLFPNNLLFCANQLLARYRERLFDRENACLAKKLVGAQAGGVAEVLENLSVECGTLCFSDRKKEQKIYTALAEKGVFPEEILVEERGTVCLILSEAETARLSYISSRVSEAVERPLIPYEATDAENGRRLITFRPAPRLDAAFGIASAKKEGSEISGDTHSTLRLGADGFLIAVSDGMGSGKEAQTVSSFAMTLIESFYRAGFCSEVVLSAVNKLLSARTEENFAALDVAAVSLSSGRCDFIKIGAPYGFTMKKEGISIVPGNALPLGILEDIRPEICTDTLSAGDVLILTSDGVTDAFGSASDFLDFLSLCKERNPQTLANNILHQAKLRSGGSPADDMTVLCLRLFEKAG